MARHKEDATMPGKVVSLPSPLSQTYLGKGAKKKEKGTVHFLLLETSSPSCNHILVCNIVALTENRYSTLFTAWGFVMPAGNAGRPSASCAAHENSFAL